MTAKALSSARDEYLEEQTEDVQAVERFRKWLKLTKPLFFRKKKKASGKS
jgi:hypothetical protein